MRPLKLPFWENFFFATALIFLPTQLGKHFWPDFAFIYSLRIDYLSPTLYLWDLLLFGLIFVWLLKKPIINITALTLLLIFLLSQSLSLFGSDNIGAGFVRLYQYSIAGLFGLYIASKRKEYTFKMIQNYLPVALFMSCLLAIGQFLLGRTLGFWILGERSFSLSTPSIATFNFLGQVFLRPYATFSHPNVLAGFLVISLAVLFWIHKKSSVKLSVIQNKFLILTMSLSVIAGFLTFSRTAILLLLFELGLLLRHQKLLLGLVLALAGPFLYVRFVSTFNFDVLSLIRREELAATAIIFFQNHLLTGIGLNNFINEMASSSLVSGASRFLQPVHNIFLLVLSETGLIGFLGFISFLAFPFVKNYFINKNLFPGLLLAMITFLGLFDHYFLTLPQGQRLLFLVWGLGMLEYYGGDSKKSHSSS